MGAVVVVGVQPVFDLAIGLRLVRPRALVHHARRGRFGARVPLCRWADQALSAARQDAAEAALFRATRRSVLPCLATLC